MTALQTPWDPDPDPDPNPVKPPLPPPVLPGLPVSRKPRGRPAPARPGTGAPPWPYLHLVVTGPAAAVQAFVAAARGPGIVPWAQDGRAVEDLVFDLAASQPPRVCSLDIDGCRVLARQFRDRFERHHRRAAAAGHARHCPLDLHALLPVPETVLRLGPADPAALAWMAAHWGVVDGLRQVVERPDLGPGQRLPRGHAWVGYGFFSGRGDTAVSLVAPMVARLGTRLGAQWPALRFVLRPGPD